MSEIFSISNKNTTAKGFLDLSRPLTMVASDKLYKTVAKKHGESPGDLLESATKLLGVIKTTRSFDLDKVWEKMEKVFNDGRPLKTPSKTDMAKFQTAFGLFYNMLNTLDANATSSLEMFEFRNTYFSAQEHVLNRIIPGKTGKDLRTLQKTLTTINTRITKVSERFNARIDAGEIGGPKL